MPSSIKYEEEIKERKISKERVKKIVSCLKYFYANFIIVTIFLSPLKLLFLKIIDSTKGTVCLVVKTLKNNLNKNSPMHFCDESG